MSVLKESTNYDIRKKDNNEPEVNDDKITMNSTKQEENNGFDISSQSNHANTEIGAQVYNADCHVTGEKNQASYTKEGLCYESSNEKEDMMNNVKTSNNSNNSEDKTKSDADKDHKSALNKVTEGDSENENNAMKDIEPVNEENKNIKDVSLNSGKGDTTQLSSISVKPNDDTDDKHKQNIEAAFNSETLSKQQVDVKDDKASTGAKAKNKKYVKPEDAKGNFYNNIQNKQKDKRNKQQTQNDQVKTDEKNRRDPKANKGFTRDSNKKPKENAALRQKAYEAYEFFWRSHSPYSQWYPSDFTVDGIKFNCAEQFMMHSKAVLFGDVQTAETILNTSDPRKQKDLGRLVENFDKSLWDDSCSAIVERGNKAKFSQNKELLKDDYSEDLS